MPTAWLDLLFNKYVLGALAIVGVLGAGWWWHTSEVDDAVEKALTAQKARLDAALLVAQLRIGELEKEHEKLLIQIGIHYKKEFEDVEARRVRDVAAARAGTLRLRIPGSVCPGPATQAGAAPAGSDGAEAGELPREVAADLLTLANDADNVVNQLTACQAVVRAQLETINKE